MVLSLTWTFKIIFKKQTKNTPQKWGEDTLFSINHPAVFCRTSPALFLPGLGYSKGITARDSLGPPAGLRLLCTQHWALSHPPTPSPLHPQSHSSTGKLIRLLLPCHSCKQARATIHPSLAQKKIYAIKKEKEHLRKKEINIVPHPNQAV